MDHKGKAPVIILTVLVLISLALAGGGFYLFQKERAKTRNLEQKLEELELKQRLTETKLKESQKSISEMVIKLQESKSQIDTLNNDLQQEKAGRLEALSKIERLRVDLEEQKKLRADLEMKFAQAQDDVRKTQSQLAGLEAKKTELESKMKDLETKTQDVELGNIVISPQTPLPSPEVEQAEAAPKAEKREKSAQVTLLEGKVLVINKDYNFLVINLGSKDGIGLNDGFSVYHKNKYIGDIKIEKVHDSMSAAGFITEDLKDRVSEGDKVVQKVK